MTAKMDVKIKRSSANSIENFGIAFLSPMNLAYIHISKKNIGWGEVIGSISNKKAMFEIESLPENGYVASVQLSNNKLFIETAGIWTPESIETLGKLARKLSDLMEKSGVNNILLHTPTGITKNCFIFDKYAVNERLTEIDIKDLTSIRIDINNNFFALSARLNALVSCEFSANELYPTDIVKKFSNDNSTEFMSRIKMGETLISLSCKNAERNVIRYNFFFKEEKFNGNIASLPDSRFIIGPDPYLANTIISLNKRGMNIIPLNNLPAMK